MNVQSTRLFLLDATDIWSFFFPRCLQNYIPAHSLTLSCPVCRQTSILPERGVAALQNNFFITNLMDVLQRREPGSCSREVAAITNIAAVAPGQLLSCPNHGGSVRVNETDGNLFYFILPKLTCAALIPRNKNKKCWILIFCNWCSGHGVLLSSLWDGHVSGVYGRWARRPSNCSS